MWVWLPWLTAASADEPAESTRPADAEIVVYGDALSPWHDTRWWIASERVDLDTPMMLDLDGYVLYAPAWQAEAMLHCRVTDPRRRGGWVSCEVEKASMRVVTYNRWQRPKDRQRVEQVLARVVTELDTLAVRLRIRQMGTVTVAKEQPDRSVLGEVLLGPAIDGFQLELPKTGWQDGAQWSSEEEPLLDLNLGMGTYGFETASHYANLVEGRHIVQTLAAANRTVVVGVATSIGLTGRPSRDGLTDAIGQAASRFLPSSDADQDYPSAPATELTEKGRLVLHAVADYDPTLGGVRERVWTVAGEGAASVHRSGRLRKLENGEVVDLGSTTQVSPPRNARLDLPLWVPISERSLSLSGQTTPNRKTSKAVHATEPR